MTDFKSLREYLPIITAFLGAVFAYLFSNRRYRNERFYKEATEALKDFYSPVFHEMRDIKLNMNLYNKERLLKSFITNHISKDTQLFKSYNQKLVSLFYELDETLRQYELKKENKILEKSAEIYDKIYYSVKKEYQDIQKSLYKQFPWYKLLNKRSFICRFFMDLSTLFYDIVQFFALCWIFLIYIIIVNKWTGQNNLYNWIRGDFLDITFIIITLYVFALAIRLPYFFVTAEYKNENRVSKRIDETICNKIKGIYIKIKNIYNSNF